MYSLATMLKVAFTGWRDWRTWLIETLTLLFDCHVSLSKCERWEARLAASSPHSESLALTTCPYICWCCFGTLNWK